MNTIYKYDVPMDNYFEITLPSSAQILSVQTQHGMPQIWILQNPDGPQHNRKFRLVGTGHQITQEQPNLDYIGTFQMDGYLVFHLFEIVY